ncbi:hypothetical protein FJY63_08690, partial [Candidatus Sumerlaeota bacterium]|nr:hypothetical protein [Candidatus Sumerlaeota bacterium]
FGHQTLAGNVYETAAESRSLELLVASVSALVFAVGFALAVYYFLFAYPVRAQQAARRLGVVYRISAHRWWWDEFYNAAVVRVFLAFAAAAHWFDDHVVDGIVNATARIVGVVGDELRRLQSGRVQDYALGTFAGVNLILIMLFGGHLGRVLSFTLSQFP